MNPFPTVDQENAFRSDVSQSYRDMHQPYPDYESDEWLARFAYRCSSQSVNEAHAIALAECRAALHWVQPGPPPDPLPGPQNPIQGVVELVDGGRRGLRDATGQRLFWGCHGLDLLSRYYRDQTTALTALDRIAGAGHHFVRIATVLPGPWWAARTGEIHPDMPGYWDAVHGLARALKVEGLRWQVTQGDMCRYYPDQHRRRVFMQNLAQTLIEEGGLDELVFSVDAGNEAWQNGEADADKLADALQAFLNVLPARVVSLTSPRSLGQDLYTYIRNNVTITDYHGPRDRFRWATQHAWDVGYWPERPRLHCLNSEMAGVNAQDGEGKTGAWISAMEQSYHWRDLEAIGTYLLAHAISNQTPTLTLSPGIISDEPFDAYPALGHIPRLLSLLPNDLSGWRVFHGGPDREFSHLQILRADAREYPNLRVEHALHPNQTDVIALAYVDAVGGTHVDPPIVSNFSGTIMHPGTMELHPLSLQAGGRLGLDLHYGRLFVGKRG